jgi:predicted amidophosphoribosyltransferase
LPAPRPLLPALCPDCGPTAGADKLALTISALVYRDQAVLLHRRLKFGGAAELAAPLATLMVAAWRARARRPVDLVARVPPDPFRWTARRSAPGRLAARAAELLDAPFVPRALRKARPTRALTGRGRAERRLALVDAFRAASHWVAGGEVLVIDDVVTTGATLREAARALHAAGALHVSALVLARTPSPTSG